MHAHFAALVMVACVAFACSEVAEDGVPVEESVTSVPAVSATTSPPTTNGIDALEEYLAGRSCDVDQRFCEVDRMAYILRSAIYGPPFTESAAEIEAMMAESDALLAEWERLAPEPIRPAIETGLREFIHPIDALTEQLGWDPYAAINTDEALAIFDDPDVAAAITEVDAYKQRCCSCEEDLSAPTGPLVLGDRTVAIYNGTPALRAALAWGFERFELAGLEVPPIASATFTVQSEMCDDIRGRYVPTERGIELEFCMNDGSMCWEDPEADPVGCEGHCPAHLPGMMAVILHEIAHTWLDANVDSIDTDRFLDHVELEAWRPRHQPWDQRGHEHAADTIAWGLMDRDIEMLRIGQPTAEELTEGFRILTGIDPLPKNP